MYILFPGRHHILTQFQHNYLSSIITNGLRKTTEINGSELGFDEHIEAIVFAVTSANHHGTKRNPIAFYQRALMIQEFCKDLPVNCLVYGVNDIGVRNDFANYTVKMINHQSDNILALHPANTLVVCSTPVLNMYEALGYAILPAELMDRKYQTYHTDLPWTLIEKINAQPLWKEDKEITSKIHDASLKIWSAYNLDEKVRTIFNDPIIGSDGDITESRNYNSYVRQMDEIAEIKFKETAPYILPGRIGDIGCAVGSWIKQASEDSRWQESDFYGIEVARQLFSLCVQRKENGEFGNPNVFFAQKNAVVNLVFQRESMNTIHTSSLTHEIESYGSRADLLNFIQNRYQELAPGGVWINRDVIGPENGDKIIYMLLNKRDGNNENYTDTFSTREELAHYLNKLSTFSKFKRFLIDFRKPENDCISCQFESVNENEYAVLRLRDAAEFMLTKDYTDNWESEMHERFCFWSFADWVTALQKVGFTILDSSQAYTNPWITKNRFEGKVDLFEKINGRLDPINFPPTNALILSKKI